MSTSTYRASAPSSIDLTVKKNVLTVKAERSWRHSEGREVVVAERPQDVRPFAPNLASTHG
ncbi:MAG TPA: Hsp20/alpha crystallin family protein [Acidimicrobiales bacterium]|nr:Hsp20/alpha crystallin family protein [Acidimicrobiales bacterium]